MCVCKYSSVHVCVYRVSVHACGCERTRARVHMQKPEGSLRCWCTLSPVSVRVLLNSIALPG